MYCTVTELKAYLGDIPSTDDVLLSTLVNAAHQRINDETRRSFEATADTARYYDASEDVSGRDLCLCADLSYIASIAIDGAALPATEYITSPRNETPWREIKIKSNSSYYWSYTTAPEDAIVITGRWAVMHSKAIASISRSGSNVVTATVSDTSGLGVGATVYVAGVTDTGFNGGAFTLTAVTATTMTWAQTASSATSTGGTILFTPASIRQACTRLAAFLYRQKDNQAGDQDRAVITESGIIMPTTLPKDVSELLRPWVKTL